MKKNQWYLRSKSVVSTQQISGIYAAVSKESTMFGGSRKKIPTAVEIGPDWAYAQLPQNRVRNRFAKE